FQKDFIEADRKVNLLGSALYGSILKIFPIPNDENNKWVSHLELETAGMQGTDSIFTRQILPVYFNSLQLASDSKSYKEADFYLEGINKFQHKYGSEVMTEDERITSEILYNKYDVFKNLYYLYMLSGILMPFFTILSIFFQKKAIRYVINFFHVLIGVFFALHTLGLT